MKTKDKYKQTELGMIPSDWEGKIMVNYQLLMLNEKNNPIHRLIKNVMVQKILIHLRKMGFVWS